MPSVFCMNAIKYRIKLVPWSIIICFYPWILLGPVSLRISIACWLCLLLLLLFPHLCFVVFVAHRWELLLKDRDKQDADTWGSSSTLPAPEMDGSTQQRQTWLSWSPPVLSSSSFFLMSFSQPSSSLMKLCISSAFCRIWSCNSMALFPPDMLFPAKQTFVWDNFLTLVAEVVVLKVGVAAKWKTRESRCHAFAASSRLASKWKQQT